MLQSKFMKFCCSRLSIIVRKFRKCGLRCWKASTALY
uniref:Uncharacterized protein n=1 Tax=Anguilla anguilla TaxID=7936 RepID=A0A0E9QGA5_ANGAN